MHVFAYALSFAVQTCHVVCCPTVCKCWLLSECLDPTACAATPPARSLILSAKQSHTTLIPSRACLRKCRLNSMHTALKQELMLLRTSTIAVLCARSASSSVVRLTLTPRACPLRPPFAVRAMSNEVEAAQKAAAAQQCAHQVALACLTLFLYNQVLHTAKSLHALHQ